MVTLLLIVYIRQTFVYLRKKRIPMRCFFMILLISLTFLSCKKDYTCQCTDATTGVGTESFTVKDKNSADAEADCGFHSDSTQNCFLSN
jgi:hypothetical protein